MDSTFQWPESGNYFTGLEVYHLLHCLVCTNSFHTVPIISSNYCWRSGTMLMASTTTTLTGTTLSLRGTMLPLLWCPLVGNCTGRGTNFPFLSHPSYTRWCDVIPCEEEGKGRDGYQGVILKPIVGSAVYWENFHPNGTGHKGVYHAGLPVKSGVKVGLNMWSWNTAWVKPEV